MQLSGGDKSEKYMARLSSVMIACVYEYNSLIAVEKRPWLMAPRLVEYQIGRTSDNVRRIDRKVKILADCDRAVSEKSEMAVVRTNTHTLVIICNWDKPTINMIVFDP